MGQRDVLKQFNLPREIVPLSKSLSLFFNYLIGWALILPIFLIANPRAVLLIPHLVFVFALTFLFAAGAGLLLSVLNVFYRDTSSALGVALMLWMWMTPVFYSPRLIPESFLWVLAFNPMADFIAVYRELVLAARLPALSLFLRVIGWTGASLCAGYWIFGRLEPQILKRI